MSEDAEREKTTRQGEGQRKRARPQALVIPDAGRPRMVMLDREGTLEIGRSSSCAISLGDESISRVHARIRVSESLVVVEDLESRNGTYLDGVPLEPGRAVPVRAPALLEVGDALLVFTAEVLQARTEPSGDVVVLDPKMQELHAIVGVVAPSDVPVLVLGETGTGKESFAAEIHRRSKRAAQKLLRLNCAALPDSLLEAELFGYVRGAFTGAVADKPGLFESAEGGTVFLDELGEIPLTTQAKLLRVLESGEVMRIGARTSIKVDQRIVAATNRDLRRAIAEGAFRSDLYYRVAGFVLSLPPLRERPHDLRALTERFVRQACAELKRPPLFVPDLVHATLASYSFPGNVRELKAAITRAVVLAPGDVLDVAQLGLPFEEDKTPVVSNEERQRIEAALATAGGNQTRAAKALGISRATLVRRLDAFALARPKKGR